MTQPAWTLELMTGQTWPVAIAWRTPTGAAPDLTGGTVTGRRAVYDPEDPDSMESPEDLAGTLEVAVDTTEVTYTPDAADVAAAGEWWVVLTATVGGAVLPTLRGRMVVYQGIPVGE